MRLKNFTFILTANCNFNCSYCMQKKEDVTVTRELIDTAVDFFYPRFDPGEEVQVGFYGGEPLLAFDRLEDAVLAIREKNKKEGKKIKYTVTTNGSLLNNEMLDFFNRHGFDLILSFDGLTQDIGRKEGTRDKLVQLLGKMWQYPGIDVEINSVFSPQTVSGLFSSMRYIIQQGFGSVTFNISTIQEWLPDQIELLEKELRRLEDYLVTYYSKYKKIPVNNFLAPNPGRFHCTAGTRHMALTPEGRLWGCFLFYDYFKTRPEDPQFAEYDFGNLKDFVTDHQARYHAVAANYPGLRQDFFQVDNNFCFLCENIENCMVCPVNAAYTSFSLGKITCTHCRLVKLQAKVAQDFRNRIS